MADASAQIGSVYTAGELGAKVPIASGNYLCVSGIGVGSHPSASRVQITENALLGSHGTTFAYELGGGSVEFVPISGSLYLVDISMPMASDGDNAVQSQALRAAFVEQNTFQMLDFADDTVTKVATQDGVSASHDPLMGWTLSGSVDQQHHFFADLLASQSGVSVDEACAPEPISSTAATNQSGYGVGGG